MAPSKIEIAKKDPQTDVDVRELLAAFEDVIADGRIIPHEAIEQVLRLSRDESRYRTVTHHWRTILFRERQVWLDGRWAHGHGFKALTPDEMVRYSHREVRAVGRQLKRALLIAATPRDEDLHDPHMRIYRQRLLSATEQIGAAHHRVLSELNDALRPPKQLRRA